MPPPSSINDVVRYRETVDEDGNPQLVPVTIGEQVVERVRTGLDLTDAAASANITRQTIWNWRRRGALDRALEAQGKPPAHADGAAYVQFVDALERAEAEAELVRLAIIQRAAEGGFRTTKTVAKYLHDPDDTDHPDGRLLERTVTEEVLAPNWLPAAWYLERRYPRKYQRKAGLSDAPVGMGSAGGDDGDEEELRTAALLEAAQGFVAEHGAP